MDTGAGDPSGSAAGVCAACSAQGQRGQLRTRVLASGDDGVSAKNTLSEADADCAEIAQIACGGEAPVDKVMGFSETEYLSGMVCK